MFHYIDTSILIPYYYSEKNSGIAQEKLMMLSQPVISNHTEVEFYSTLSRKVRQTEEELTLSNATKIIYEFNLHLRQGYYKRVRIQNKHFNQAKSWLSQCDSALRGWDALHLAFAYQNNFTLMTADEKLAKTAEKFGAKVEFLS